MQSTRSKDIDNQHGGCIDSESQDKDSSCDCHITRDCNRLADFHAQTILVAFSFSKVCQQC